MNYFLQFICCFGAIYFFTFIFNTPSRVRIVAAGIGSAAYLINLLFRSGGWNDMLNYFLASLLISLCGEIFAFLFKTPVTSIISSSIVGLVPGLGLYETMVLFMENQMNLGIQTGIQTLLNMGAMAMALAFGLICAKVCRRTFRSVRAGLIGKREG